MVPYFRDMAQSTLVPLRDAFGELGDEDSNQIGIYAQLH
jgi:hypothetical protein